MITRARFVIRPNQEGQGDIILGVMFKAQGDLLTPGRVYEVREVLDTLVIADVGPAAITMKRGTIGGGWFNSIDDVLTYTQGRFIFTEAEAAQENAAKERD